MTQQPNRGLVSPRAILALFASTLLLATFAASARAVTIPTVPVGNAGNAGELSGAGAGGFGPDAVVGGVAYDYRIGTTEVTNAQYAEFLNAKAASDPLGLYNTNMGSDARGGITRSGSSGSYTYATKTNMSDKPVNYVSWYDAVRFANWLHNGQGSGDTETGAYTLLGGTPTPSNGLSITRNSSATWFLTSEDEWYKAAYHQPAAQGGDSDDYWLYPTASNSVPTIATANSVGDISNPGANVANYNLGADWNSQNGNVTTVGSAGPTSESYYGTSDQGGNVWEWNEALFFGSYRILRGSSLDNSAGDLRSSNRLYTFPWAENNVTGFRVATVPEPSTLALAAFAALGMLLVVRHRGQAIRVAPAAACILVASATSVHATSFAFHSLGDLPGGSFSSLALGVSADGSVVVGQSNSASGNEAFRWTSDGGMVGLGDLAGGSFQSFAIGASGDGSVVVGSSSSASGTNEAFRWTSGGGMVGLGDLPGGGFQSNARGVSADGSVVVGKGWSASSGTEAFRWTSGGGMVGLGGLPGGSFYSDARGVSADGTVIVGQSRSFFGPEAFLWTSGGGMVGLGDLPGSDFYSDASSVSADGSVVVGQSFSASGAEAFRWTSGGGMVGLGDLPGGSFTSEARGVSADGSVVVGRSIAASGNEAFLWTQSLGMTNLRDYLVLQGVDGLSGWTLSSAAGISADGRTIVGFGTNPDGFQEAWIATVPEPSSLALALCGATAIAVIATRRHRLITHMQSLFVCTAVFLSAQTARAETIGLPLIDRPSEVTSTGLVFVFDTAFTVVAGTYTFGFANADLSFDSGSDHLVVNSTNAGVIDSDYIGDLIAIQTFHPPLNLGRFLQGRNASTLQIGFGFGIRDDNNASTIDVVQGDIREFSAQMSVVPEPSTLVLAGCAFFALLFITGAQQLIGARLRKHKPKTMFLMAAIASLGVVVVGNMPANAAMVVESFDGGFHQPWIFLDDDGNSPPDGTTVSTTQDYLWLRGTPLAHDLGVFGFLGYGNASFEFSDVEVSATVFAPENTVAIGGGTARSDNDIGIGLRADPSQGKSYTLIVDFAVGTLTLSRVDLGAEIVDDLAIALIPGFESATHYRLEFSAIGPVLSGRVSDGNTLLASVGAVDGALTEGYAMLNATVNNNGGTTWIGAGFDDFAVVPEPSSLVAARGRRP